MLDLRIDNKNVFFNGFLSGAQRGILGRRRYCRWTKVGRNRRHPLRLPLRVTERLMEQPIFDKTMRIGLFGQSNLMILHLVLTGVPFLAVKGLDETASIQLF